MALTPLPDPFYKDGKTLRDESLLVLTGLALGLTSDQTAAARHWSWSKVNRWRAALQRAYGKSIITVMVMLLNDQQSNRLDIKSLYGMYDAELRRRFDIGFKTLARTHLNSRQQEFLAESLRAYPMSWTADSCPPVFRTIVEEKLGLELPERGSLVGLYALVMAIAAMQNEIYHGDLPDVFTVQVVLRLPDGVTITVVGTPGTRVDYRVTLVLPDYTDSEEELPTDYDEIGITTERIPK